MTERLATSVWRFVKVCEYDVDKAVRRKYSVASIAHPRTAGTNAYVAFNLMGYPRQNKPWAWKSGDPDDSRSVVLDLDKLAVLSLTRQCFLSQIPKER